ncbi:MAG TPA: YfhO family protein [Candidatus Limiplasma sp.]|nr:YfhO family protein [Candidatus Limiplasma sp.]HPS80345.1 YfhO family protein [Candidatus Limiplasma sp.]
MKRLKPFPSSKALLYLSAFGIPILLYMMVMVACKITPFGTRTLLVWDANGQYAAFLTELRRIMLGQADPFYTFHTALGSGLAGLLSYYLASPWNVIFTLFKETDLPLAYSLLVLMKIGLAGLCMMVYLHNTYRLNQKGLLFAVTYALMGYVAVYSWSVMWMDGVAIFPLVVLGLRKISKREKPITYIVALAYALFCNYYIGFMICLFSVLFFAYLALEDRKALRTAFVFMGASLLAGGLAAVMLIPAYAEISSSYQMLNFTGESLARINSLFSIMTKSFTGAVSYDQLRYGQPNDYIGIPVLVLAFSYFLNPAIPLRKRMLSTILPGILLVSFILKPLYLLWHGNDFPSCFPARFSFLFCFVLIELAVQGYLAMPRPASLPFRRRLLWLSIGMVAFTAIAFRTDLENYLTYETVILDVFTFIATCLLLIRPSPVRYRRIACVLLCAMQVAGLSINAYMGYHRMDIVNDMTTDQYAKNITENSGYVRRILSSDPETDGLYRLEKNYRISENDAMSLDYPGLSHYSSATNPTVARFADQIGLYHSYLRVLYGNGTTPVLDSLLGVKYILYNTEASLESLPSDYTALWTDGMITAYQNPYALPLAMMTPRQSKATLDSGNPFLSQNSILSDLTGEDIQAFIPLDAKITSDGDGFVYAEIPIAAGAKVYMLSYGSYYYLNELPGQDEHLFQGCVLLPISKVDTTYHLKMWSSTGIAPQFATFSMDALASSYKQLAKYGYEVQSDTASHLSINVTADDQHTQLMLTIPYHQGWTAWVDGKKQSTLSKYGALLSVELTPGNHHVELRFMPSGLLAGAIISGVSLFLLALRLILLRRKALRR